jgi:hypothetical protein
MGGAARQYFFITSLPRSRTAWTANYLSFNGVSCLHDGFRGLTSPDQIRERLDATCARVAGSADPAILMFQERIFELFPKARYVYIFRDAKTCELSWRNAGGTSMHKFAVRAVDFLKRRADILVVPYEELDDKIDLIGEFVTDGKWTCPKWRKDILVDMNIQQDMDKVAVSAPPVYELLKYAKL